MRCVKAMVCAILILGTGVCSAVDGYLNVTKYDSTNPANLWLNVYVISAGPMGRLIETDQMGETLMVDAQAATTNWIWEAAIMHYGANEYVQVGGLYKYKIRRGQNGPEVSRGEQAGEATACM